MFIEITKVNSFNEEGKALIKSEDIVGIKERHVESEKLYDSNENVVSETPKDKLFGVLVANDKGNNEVFFVKESEYTRLVKILTSTESK